MNIGIIVDSCCDLSPKLIDITHADIASLKIDVGNKQFIDDRTLDVPQLLQAIKACKQAPSTACPSTTDFVELMKKYEQCFVITLSSNLSGTYNSAIVAKDLVLEEYPEKKIYVCDSLSASSTEVQLALYAHELINLGHAFEEIIELLEKRKACCKTMFVLEDLSTLMKNGRLGKVAGTVATFLSLRPIMVDNGNGEIALLEKVRGTQKALARMSDIICEGTKNEEKKSIRLILAHCNCKERADNFKKDILEKCSAIKEVLVVDTRGLSTVYTNDGGVIISYYTLG